MIHKLELSNFQSHEHSVIKFSPGVNAIVGSSDSGKTAIFRAIRWLGWNRPSGDAFRSHWGGDTIVDLELDNGQVQRVRGDKENSYVLDSHDEYKALGKEVPEEVIRFLNLNEINLQQQLDRPFLLDSSSGEVAQHFNKVAHLDKIDRALQRTDKKIRAFSQDIKYSDQQIEKLNIELLPFTDLDELEEETVHLEQLENDRVALIGKISQLTILSKRYMEIESAFKRLLPLLDAEKIVLGILSLINNKNTIASGIQRLTGCIKRIMGLSTEISELARKSAPEKLVDAIIELISDREQIILRKTICKKSIIDLKKMDEFIVIQKKELVKLEKSFAKAMPDICPLCGRG